MKLSIVSTFIAAVNAGRLGENPLPVAPLGATEAEVLPEDSLEAEIISTLVEQCDAEVAALLSCYDGNEAALMTCTNCAWMGFAVNGEPECTSDLDDLAAANYAACGGICKSECDDEVAAVYDCGKPAICPELFVEEAEKEDEVLPEDSLEAEIISTLVEQCDAEVADLLSCYDGNEAALMTCTNCAWHGFVVHGETEGCPSNLDAIAEANYDACAASCKSECDFFVSAVYDCGKPAICPELFVEEAAKEDEVLPEDSLEAEIISTLVEVKD